MVQFSPGSKPVWVLSSPGGGGDCGQSAWERPRGQPAGEGDWSEKLTRVGTGHGDDPTNPERLDRAFKGHRDKSVGA
eukprot:352312-Chlamydomonas_euryale.AAC.7